MFGTLHTQTYIQSQTCNAPIYSKLNVQTVELFYSIKWFAQINIEIKILCVFILLEN
jgi:hypothetical protein